MSLRKQKKKLKQDLRAKRTKSRSGILLLCLVLVCMSAIGAYLLWNHQRPAALLEQGVRLEQREQFELALLRYQELTTEYPDHPLAAEALYRSGQIFQHDLDQVQQALLQYLRLEHDFPHNENLLAAQREAAELTKNRLDDCGQAIPIYQRLAENASATGADGYLYEVADCYAREENWMQAAIEFEALLATYPQTARGEEVRFRLANAWLLSGKREKARQVLQQLAEQKQDSLLREEASFRLAEMLEEDEQLQKALEAYKKLTKYPRQELLKKKIINLNERMARKKKVL